jgi:gluconokinase
VEGAVLVVMGVSGCGKTTVGRNLAQRTGWPFLDADDLHSPEAVAKMAGGVPLTDADRWPWLDRVATWIEERRASGEPGIVACSALKRAYRDHLRRADPGLVFVYLRADRQAIGDRLARRSGHFFPLVLVWAQFDDLEEPGPEEDVITVPIGQSPGTQVDTVIRALAA